MFPIKNCELELANHQNQIGRFAIPFLIWNVQLRQITSSRTISYLNKICNMFTNVPDHTYQNSTGGLTKHALVYLPKSRKILAVNYVCLKPCLLAIILPKNKQGFAFRKMISPLQTSMQASSRKITQMTLNLASQTPKYGFHGKKS